MEGIKATVLETSGLLEKAEGLIGVHEKVGSIVMGQEGFSGEDVTSGLADVLAKKLGLQFNNRYMQTLVYCSSTYLMLEMSQFIFDGLGGFTSLNTLGLSIAQLKDLVKEVLSKLDAILDEPGQSCSVFMQDAFLAIENDFHRDGRRNFEDAKRKAVKGFNFLTQSCNPEGMVTMTRMKILADVSLATYNENDNKFTKGLDNLSEKQNNWIFDIIRTNLDMVIDAMKNLKKKGLFKRKKTFEGENQNLLDILLRQTLPLLIQFQPTKPPLAISSKNPHIILNPRYVPEGLEDAAFLVDVAIWKSEHTLHVLKGNSVYSVRIIDHEDVTISIDDKEVRFGKEEIKKEAVDNMVTAAVLVEMILKQNNKIIGLLAKFGNLKKYENTSMKTVCQSGSSGCLQDLMENSKKIYPDLRLVLGGIGWTMLTLAAANGNTAVVKTLVEKYKADVDKTDIDGGGTPLGWAIACNHLQTVKMLLHLGAARNNVKLPSGARKLTDDIVNVDKEEEKLTRYLQSVGVTTC